MHQQEQLLDQKLLKTTQLHTLTLCKNKLTALPPALCTNLTQLKDLNLHTNKFTVLPPDFGNLGTLQKLQLYENQLDLG